MAGESSIEERLVDLESRWAYQEDALNQLSDVLAAQQARIDRLEALLEHWIEATTQTNESEPFDPARERPPHY